MTNNSRLIEGIELINYKINNDKRGYLFESYNKSSALTGIEFCQDNIVESRYGVIRGMHFQIDPMAQSKLVTVIKGTIQDVVVDIRKSSKTFGNYFSIILSEESKKQIFIPRGFAHGFLTYTTII